MKRNEGKHEDKSASYYDGSMFPLKNDDGEVPLAMIPLASIVNRFTNGN
ncbi:MAG: hypothetical protein K2O14_08080 [Oscillospiraceae bacterium]|nr:hypothetical protein [Oscillospiraceae bacterium]